MRNLGDHIGPEELANLPESLEEARHDKSYGELFLHLDQCPDCQELIDMHYALYGLEGKSSDNPSCPPQSEWLEYAAGLGATRAEFLLAHASKCRDCAAQLREATELMRTPMTETLVEGVKSSRPAWQQRMATRMAKEARGHEHRPLRLVFWPKRAVRSPWLLVSVTAVLLVSFAFGVVQLWNAVFPSDSRLLAMAYNQQRRIPLRIAGGDPVPMVSETRGAESRRTSPTALLKLKLRAQQHLEKEPANAYWHQILGEVNLLEGDAFEARRNLEIAQTGNPTLRNLQSDLAAAWFLVGESKGSTEAYAEAAELYSKALLDPHADSGLLYFNRALCWERQNVRQNAISDLHSALAAEKSKEWRRAIEAEISRLTSISSGSALGDDSPVDVAHHGPFGAFSDDGYEQALDRVTTELLPRWPSDPSARAEIAKTAQSGLRHQDRWLGDWIKADHGRLSLKGDRALALALASISSGDLEHSLAESTKAVQSYNQAGNNPGQVRATLAKIYALQRLDRFRDCLSTAASMEQKARISQYAWIRAQLYMEEGSCRLAAGDFDGASGQVDRAASSTANHGLFGLYLRAVAGQSQVLQFRGSPIEAWQLNTSALSICRRLRCPPIREYLLVYTLVQGAQSLDLPHVAAELMRTGESLAADSGDATVHAYATEILAVTAGLAGDFDESDRSFARAVAFADRVPSMQSVGLYRAEWQTDRADVLLRRGQPMAALELLSRGKDALLTSDYQYGRIRYFTRLSAAQLATGDVDRALKSAIASVTEVEKTLPTLRTVIEREQWQRENTDCYAQLIKVYIRQNRMDDAFETWERYRYLPIANTVPATGSRASANSQRQATQGPQVLVLALVDDKYMGWLVGTNPLRVLRTAELGNRTTIHRLVTTFYHLCSDPDSKVRDIRATGEQIYSVLLRPFADSIGASQPIRLDLDSSLASVAFSALTSPDGTWFGSSYEIRVLPFWWASRPRSLKGAEQAFVDGRVVIVDGFARHQSAYSEARDLAAMFVHSLVLDEQDATPSAALRALHSAVIFHFSGHAVSESGSTRLLLPVRGQVQPYLAAEDFLSLRLHNCQLAVMAACNTNASNPDRIEYLPDLRNALLQSGVHAVIASHWDVDDGATAALMNSFYRHLLGGDSPARSLEIAEHAIALDPKWRHPYYWASFQLFAN